MKKIIFLCFCATLFIAGISSCSKQNSNPDLTSNLIGNYSGSILDTSAGSPSTSTTGVIVSVTKIDNTHIQVTPATGYIPFTAILTSAPNGVYLTTQSGTYNGISYVGSQFINNLTAPVNGLYNSTTNQITYSLLGVQSGAYGYEVYLGTHQ